MADKFMQIVLTPAVQRAQDKYFGRHQVVKDTPEMDALTPDEAGFIASRDSVYMATVSETGWPLYTTPRRSARVRKGAGAEPNRLRGFQGQPPACQHRQSRHHRSGCPLHDGLPMPHPAQAAWPRSRARRARHAELRNELAPEPLRSKVERLFLVQVVSYDWNCPQYITPRFTAAEMEKYVAPLKARVAKLEAQLAAREGSQLGGNHPKSQQAYREADIVPSE
jgi:hypothetical protein